MTNEQPVAVTLAACPIGLFWCGGELCLKTEYGSNEGRIDAYIVSSGEFFWGHQPQTVANQRATLVIPIDTDESRHRLAAERVPEGMVLVPVEPTQAAKPFADLMDWIRENQPRYANPAEEVQIENWPYTIGIGQIMAVAALAGAGGWHRHTGETCPVDPDADVEVITRDWSVVTMKASAIHWRPGSYIYEIPGPMPPECDVMFYRLAAAPSIGGGGDRG